MKSWSWLLVAIVCLFWSCAKNAKNVVRTEESKPEIALSVSPSRSVLVMPVSVSLATVEQLVNQQIPWVFHNPEWPDFTYAKCGEPDVRFEVKREPIHLKCDGTTLYFELDLQYAISGQMCATCWGDKCMTPKVPFSCGSGQEGMRKMNWKGKMMWGVDANWKLKTISSNISLTPYNPCELTFLKLNFTQEVTNEMTKALQQSLDEGDRYFSSMDFSGKIKPWLETCNSGLPVGEFGFLSTQVTQLYIGNLRSDRDSIYASVGLDALFQFKKNKQAQVGVTLPKVVMSAPPSKNSEVNLQGVWNWIEWNSLVNQQLIDRVWVIDQEGGEIIFKQSTFSASENGKVHGDWILDIKKGKWKLKNVHLSADLSIQWDKENQLLSLKELDWDVDSRHQLLKWGIKIETWNEEWTKSKMLEVPFKGYYPEMITKVNGMMHSIEKNGIRLGGEVKSISVEQCSVRPEGVVLELKAIGDLNLKLKELHWE